MSVHVHARRYLYTIINSPDNDLTMRGQQEMSWLRNKHPDLALLTVHATFCSSSNYKQCMPCNSVKDM